MKQTGSRAIVPSGLVYCLGSLGGHYLINDLVHFHHSDFSPSLLLRVLVLLVLIPPILGGVSGALLLGYRRSLGWLALWPILVLGVRLAFDDVGTSWLADAAWGLAAVTTVEIAMALLGGKIYGRWLLRGQSASR